MISNNIFASVFPAGAAMYAGYLPRADITSAYLMPEPASNHAYSVRECAATCYVVSNNNIYSSTFADARTTGNNTPPTCATGVCVDGAVAWKFEQALPGASYLVDTRNITAWKVTGNAPGATKDFVFLNRQYSTFPTRAQFSSNLYSMEGNFLSLFDGVTPFAAWLKSAGATGAPQDAGSLYGAPTAPDAPGITPNFVSLEAGDFRFNTTYSGPGTASACGGTGAGTVSPACGIGFVPWDYSSAGAR